MAKLIAQHDKIVVKPYEKDDDRIGGIIIPDAGKEKSNLYEIIDVGPGRYYETGVLKGERIPMDSKVGQIVIIPKALVRITTIDGVDYGTCREVEIEAEYAEEDTLKN